MSASGLDGDALAAAGLVGTWVTDVAAGLSVVTGPAAALLSGDAGTHGRPVILDAALARIHPEDRPWVFAQVRRARTTGGPFAAEFRILDGAGNVRWILNRGHLRPDAVGAMRGCGAYIDTTESHRVLMFPPARPAARPRGRLDPLEEAADHALLAHAALGRTGQRSLRLFADLLLAEIGRTLARRRR